VGFILSVIGSVPQLFFRGIDGSDWRQLTVSSEGVQDAALSDHGRVAFVVTGAGSILRIDTASGAAQVLIGPTPHDLKLSGAPSPGYLSILTGVSLAAIVQQLRRRCRRNSPARD
jgi:hypothetical protein